MSTFKVSSFFRTIQSFFLNLFDSEGTLSQKAVRGGFWVFMLRVISRIFSFVRTVVLARLLAPEDFGLFGIALLTLSILEAFSQTGFDKALIQRSEDIRTYLDTAWTIQLFRGVLLYFVLFLLAPSIGLFFNNAESVRLIRIVGIALLLTGINNIGVVYFQKELEFKKEFTYQFGHIFADFSVSIISALLFKDAWALAYGFVAGNFVRVIISYKIIDYHPRFLLDKNKFKKLFRYGKWISLSTILSFLITEGDDIFVGRLLSVSSLGLYQLAYKISNIPTTEITHVVSQISFPTYSKIQKEKSLLKSVYLNVLKLTAVLSFPLAGLIFILAPEFVNLFLGENWIEINPIIQILVIWGLIRSIGATTGPLFRAVDRPDLIAKLQFSKAVLLGLLIYPMIKMWGLIGVSWVVVINSIIVNLAANWKAIKVIQCDVYEYVKQILFPIIATLIMIIIILLVKSIIIFDFFVLLVLALIGFIAYWSMISLFEKLFNYDALFYIRTKLLSLV